MEETTPAQPDPPASMPPPTTGPLGAPAQPARARGGCVGRFFAALLVVIITTFLALAAGAAGLLYLGFTPALPGQLAAAQVQVATLQAANSQMQTQVLAADQRGSADHEVLGDLKRQFETIAGLRDQLRQEREASIAQNATLVAEVRSGRDAVALFATAEAGRAALLSELDRRSARVERFLQRLGDIADDTASDIGSTTPSVPPVTPTPATSPTPTPAAAATATLVASPPATATEVPSRTPAAAPGPSPTPTPRPTPRATATPGR